MKAKSATAVFLHLTEKILLQHSLPPPVPLRNLHTDFIIGVWQCFMWNQLQLTQASDEGWHGVGEMTRNDARLRRIVVFDPMKLVGCQAAIQLLRGLPVDIEWGRLPPSNVGDAGTWWHWNIQSLRCSTTSKHQKNDKPQQCSVLSFFCFDTSKTTFTNKAKCRFTECVQQAKIHPFTNINKKSRGYEVMHTQKGAFFLTRGFWWTVQWINPCYHFSLKWRSARVHHFYS